MKLLDLLRSNICSYTFEANESIFHMQIEKNIAWFKISIVMKGCCLSQKLEYTYICIYVLRDKCNSVYLFQAGYW